MTDKKTGNDNLFCRDVIAGLGPVGDEVVDYDVADAILKAKKVTTDRDVRRTWILFGDPTMKLR